MFIKKRKKDDGKINPYAVPGLLNDYKARMSKNLKEYELEVFLDAIIKNTGLKREEIISKSRKHEMALARHAFFHICKRYTNRTLVSIGMYVGVTDHSTVLSGLKTIKDLIETSDEVSSMIYEIEKSLPFLEFDPEELAYEVIGIKKAS